MVLKSLSLGFYRTFWGAERGFDRTFRGSIGPFRGFDRTFWRAFWGGRRFEGTVLRFPLGSDNLKIKSGNVTAFSRVSSQECCKEGVHTTVPSFFGGRGFSTLGDAPEQFESRHV